ncbi:hypothetical protein M378DRAFT_67402 [Amanita muscaria Koide BX008]|uniref:Membrane anchor Opy2 N-terminal domain-containing protein n=1 Tax=Amanita muscaria (strain Koide BX008) TaxID=946122 RepID=A0A0C2T2M0_AMAMK|nr:hypothetical protein M378DRAFT_67402 [Amanita muscaria Koide BX008]
MHINPLLPRQCIQCPDPQPCNCGPNQDCFQINRDCNTCSQTKCVDRASSASSSAGPGKGALAGGIVGALLFIVIAVGLFLLYRRRSRRKRVGSTALPEIKEVPASAEAVLNRPDPAENPSPPTHVNNVRVYPMTSTTTINLDPEPWATHNVPPSANNPFEDNHSIQTVETEGTNVIPIAFVPSESLLTQRSGSSTSSSSSQPARPTRSPELDLNLDHVNVSDSSVRTRDYSRSTRSGVTRNSFMSGASYSSDFLEAPVIVTSKTAVRQVLGVVKPQVITAGSSESLKPPLTRPVNKSPLASSSFGPQDLVSEGDETRETGDPFGDEHSSRAVYGVSASPATSTFSQAAARSEGESSSSGWIPEQPKVPWKGHQPSPSISTQAGSVIDIGSVTRVNLSPGNSADGVPYRTAMAKLVDPATLQEQQRKPLAHAQAQAQAQNADKSRRASGSSAISAASRAYSILESFPFVPPSPISDRPIRSPPRSPHNQQTFSSNASSPLAQQAFTITPPSPLPQDSDVSANAKADEDMSPPSRHILGLSGVSTASSGLGSFPFQIDSGLTAEVNARPPASINGRQRASLDTLALTSDLSSYPLGFDRDSIPVPPVPKKI